MPVDQHGGVSGRGTDFATYVVRASLEYAALAEWSIFVLYLDLVKAYDRILRELVIGFPANLLEDKVGYLVSLGIAEESARWIAEYIEQHGCLMKQWGCDAKSVALLSSLHAGAWFQYGDLPTCIKTFVGGRQGLKFGAMVFNGGYTLALFMLNKALLTDDIVLKVAQPCDAFLASS